MTSPPCTFLGGATGHPGISHCRKHGDWCHSGAPVNNPNAFAERDCGSCPDHAVYQPTPYGGAPIRNLIYHIYPLRSGAEIWRANVRRLLERIGQFDGKRVVGIATGPGCESAEDVRIAFGEAWRDIHFVDVANNPRIYEGATLPRMLDIVASNDPREITFFAHAKGVTHRADEVPVHEWTRLLYEVCLDDPAAVARALETHPTAGAFKLTGRTFHDSSCDWFFAGTFWWMRNIDLYGRNWRKIETSVNSAEAYPGIHFRRELAHCLFFERPSGAVDLYNPACWAKVAEEYEEWKLAQHLPTLAPA